MSTMRVKMKTKQRCESAAAIGVFVGFFVFTVAALSLMFLDVVVFVG